MKEFRFFIGSLAVIFIFTALTFAQTSKAEKIGVVNWTAFEDENTGIKELTERKKQLEKEFEPLRKELLNMAEKYKEKQNALNQLVAQKCENTDCSMTLKSAVDDINQLDSDIRKKQADYQCKYESRRLVLILSVEANINKAIEVFAKEHGYAVILDISKMKGLDVSELDDLTDQFIYFYNEVYRKR